MHRFEIVREAKYYSSVVAAEGFVFLFFLRAEPPFIQPCSPSCSLFKTVVETIMTTRDVLLRQCKKEK